MEDDAIIKKTVSSAAWTYLSYGLSKSANFITTMILARLILPAEFGIVGFAVTAMAFYDAVRDFGISMAIIQRRDDIENAAKTGFWLNIGSNLIIWLVACATAPAIANFFHEPQIIWVLPVMSFSFVINSLGATHDALLQREMKFSRRVIPQVFNSVSKGLTSIVLALFFGQTVWALVWGLVVGQVVYTILVWKIVDFRPALSFDMKVAKELALYGYKVSLDAFLGALQANIDYVFIGRFLGETALGFYTIAYRVPELVIINICTVIAQVLFPAYSSIQNDREQLKKAVFAALRYVSIITIPAGVGLALIAPLFMEVVFGEIWIPSAPIMAALAIYGIMLSISWNMGDVYKAIDRADILWKTAIFEFALLAPTLYFLSQYSAFAVSLGHVFVATIVTVVRLGIAIRILHLNVMETIQQLVPAGFSSTMMAIAVWLVLKLTIGLPDVLVLSLSVFVGAIVYPAVLWWFERELFIKIMDIIRKRFAKVSVEME